MLLVRWWNSNRFQFSTAKSEWETKIRYFIQGCVRLYGQKWVRAIIDLQEINVGLWKLAINGTQGVWTLLENHVRLFDKMALRSAVGYNRTLWLHSATQLKIRQNFWMAVQMKNNIHGIQTGGLFDRWRHFRSVVMTFTSTIYLHKRLLHHIGMLQNADGVLNGNGAEVLTGINIYGLRCPPNGRNCFKNIGLRRQEH
jgi:hypothetical protein